MRSSPLILFSASGALAANYTAHSRTPYNTSASTATTIAHSTESASGYMVLNMAPTTLRTSVLPALSVNWTASVGPYGAQRQGTESSTMPSSSASPARLAAANYTIAANGSLAATHAPAPSALNATVLVTTASVSTPAPPVYTASSRTNRTGVANVTVAAPYAAAAYPMVSDAVASAPSSASAYPSAWPLKSLSAPANGTYRVSRASVHRRSYVSVPKNATTNFSSSYNASSSSPQLPLPTNGTSGASLASPHHRPYVLEPHNTTTYWNSSSSSPQSPLTPSAPASSAPAAYLTFTTPLNASFAKLEPATSSSSGTTGTTYEATLAVAQDMFAETESSASQKASGPEIKTFWMTPAESATATPSVEVYPTMQ